MEAGLSEARLKSEQEWSKGTDQEAGHEVSLSLLSLPPQALALLERIEIHQPDLLQYVLHPGESTQALPDILLHLGWDGLEELPAGGSKEKQQKHEKMFGANRRASRSRKRLRFKKGKTIG
jgi:hypothetical protein